MILQVKAERAVEAMTVNAVKTAKMSSKGDLLQKKEPKDEFEMRHPPKKEPNTSQEPKKTPKVPLSKATEGIRAAVQPQKGINTTSVFGIGVGR